MHGSAQAAWLDVLLRPLALLATPKEEGSFYLNTAQEAQVDLPAPVTLGEAKVVIGREASTNVNLVLRIPTVSSTHAMIDFVDGEYFVTDLSSTNGTFLNGEELPAGKPIKLAAGAEVIFGDEFLAKFVLEEVEA